MKKRDIFFCAVILIIIFINLISADGDITGQSITGEAVTGKALQSSLALNITVSYPIPIIIIISPENETYLRNESILVNYTSINADYIWYNFDSGTNITLSGSFYVNLSQGPHTLNIYANNSYNESTIEILNFITNSSFLTILYSEYNGTTKGNSTNFLEYTYEDLQILNNPILENTDYGKIRFDDVINVTDDLTSLDNFVDLDSYTNISSNRIELNPAALPNFNTSATLWLYNLSFTNPRILKDGVVCPTTECIKESYTYPSTNGSDGVLRFYVTHFTVYSAEETPSTYTPPSGSRGGGGSSSEEIIQEIISEEEENVTIIPDEIKVSLKPGETSLYDIYIMNNYGGVLKGKIEVFGIEKFLTLSETEIVLPYKEIKPVKLNFAIPEGTPPDNYVGRIRVTVGGEIYESFVSIDVQSESSLFDVSLELDKGKFPLNPGSYIWFKTTIYNVGGEEGVNVSLTYTIKDSYGKVIFEGQGTETVDVYLEKEGKIKLPEKTLPGKHSLSIKLEYGGKTAVTSAIFDVEKRRVPLIWKILTPILFIFLVFFILWWLGKKEEKKRRRERIRKEEALEY